MYTYAIWISILLFCAVFWKVFYLEIFYFTRFFNVVEHIITRMYFSARLFFFARSSKKELVHFEHWILNTAALIIFETKNISLKFPIHFLTIFDFLINCFHRHNLMAIHCFFSFFIIVV